MTVDDFLPMLQDATTFELVLSTIVSVAALYFSYLAKTYAQRGNTKTKDLNERFNDELANDIREITAVTRELAQSSEEMISWKRSYDPSPWRTGQGVVEWIEDHERNNRIMSNRIDRLQARVDRHLPPDEDHHWPNPESPA